MSYTYRFGVDGVELNTEATPDEPFVDIELVQGLSNAPFRTTERPREGMDGGFVDVEFERQRTIVLEGTVYCNTPELLEPFMDQLKANYAPRNTSQPFFLSAPGTGQRIMFCKSYGCRYDINAARRVGSSPVQFQLTAEDPTIYGVGLVSSKTTLGGVGIGRGYNKAYNYGYGPPVAAGRVAFNNGGNRPTKATLVIEGPVENPVIVHDVTGRRLNFGITLLEEEKLVIDLRNRTILLNGTANRRTALLSTSRWFLLPPGNNSLRFQGTRIQAAPEPTLRVEARSAYR